MPRRTLATLSAVAFTGSAVADDRTVYVGGPATGTTPAKQQLVRTHPKGGVATGGVLVARRRVLTR